ncbi:hypothetical protein JCM10449v2_006792 [Rhodotorula kratochvilovae]
MGLFDRKSSSEQDPPPSFPSSSASHAPYPPDKPPPPPTYQHPHPTSSYASPSQPLAPSYAALHLARSDRVRLIGFPDAVVQPVQMAIQNVWAPGVQKMGPYDASSYEFKLKGNPWYGQGIEAVPSRRLMCHLLAALSAQGWHLAAAVDLSKKGWDKDTLLFRSGPAMQRYVFSVSFNEGDKIRIIDPPSEEVRMAFVAAVSSWPAGIQQEKLKEPGCTQLKLRGYPWWTSDGAQVNHARLLACRILGALDEKGWELVGAVDLSVGGGEGGQDLDSWFFSNKL